MRAERFEAARAVRPVFASATGIDGLPVEALYIGESLLVAALSVAAIAYPKTRQFGAGLLLGIAIATVIWSGLCALIGTGL